MGSWPFARQNGFNALAIGLLLTGCALPSSEPWFAAADTTCIRSGEHVSAVQLMPISTILEVPVPGRTSASPLRSLVRPEQVAVSPGAVFIADIGHRQILRVDPVQSSFVPLFFLEERPAGLSVDRSQTLYLALPATRRVVQLAADGRVSRVFGDPGGRLVPRDVAVSEAGRIFVADAVNARVLVFDRFGQVVGSIGERGDRPNPFSSVDALWLDRDALYVLDATARRILIFPGQYGPPAVIELTTAVSLPVALAVDRWQRVYVADRARGNIIVYDPASDAGPTRLEVVPPLGDLSDIWIDDFSVLYLADVAASTVLSFQLASPCQ